MRESPFHYRPLSRRRRLGGFCTGRVRSSPADQPLHAGGFARIAFPHLAASRRRSLWLFGCCVVSATVPSVGRCVRVSVGGRVHLFLSARLSRARDPWMVHREAAHHPATAATATISDPPSSKRIPLSVFFFVASSTCQREQRKRPGRHGVGRGCSECREGRPWQVAAGRWRR